MPAVPKPKRNRNPTFIRAWRESLGHTQQLMADRIGISRTNYGRIENGKVPYNQDIIEVCAVAMGRSVTDLLERDPIVEKQVDDLREILSKAKPEDRQRILNAAKSFIDIKD